MTSANLWQFLAGLGLFLLAMKQLEEALASLGSNSFRELLRRHTSSPLRAIFSGTLATTIVQSSSLVGLFTLALAGAGMLQLVNAVGVILGANLGTTITGWLVAALGFKLSLSGLALPLIALGALGLSLLSRGQAGWRFLFALGLLLFGLDYMKTSLEALQAQFDIEMIRSLHPLWMFLVGALFTAVIQSSSGTMVITLGALHAGLIELPQAAALIIGADLGTTSTLVLGGLPGSQLQRQIAAAHFFFNLITNLVALLSLPMLLWLAVHVYQLGEQPLLALVAIHSSFNVLGIAIFYPFIKPFVAGLQKLFPQEDDYPLQAIPSAAADIAVEALDSASRELFLTVLDLNRHCFKIRETSAISHYRETYDQLKHRELDMLMLSQKLRQQGLSVAVANKMEQALKASREIMMAAKEIKDIRENLIKLRHHEAEQVLAIMQRLSSYQSRFYQQLQAVLNSPQSESAKDMLSALAAENEVQHTGIHQQILPLVNDAGLKSLCPTLLNINREVFLSNQNLRAAGIELSG